MEKYELPLVIFTVLSQMSVGITLILTLRTLQGKLESKRLYWLVSGLVLAVASVAAILHLAHPDRAYDALINLQHAWLNSWRNLIRCGGRGDVFGKRAQSASCSGLCSRYRAGGGAGDDLCCPGNGGDSQRSDNAVVLYHGVGDGVCGDSTA